METSQMEIDATSVSDPENSNSTVNLEDTFITLQTKEGHTSQQIPLYQFLEQVVGGKIDSDVKQKTISLLIAGSGKSSSTSAGNKEVHSLKDCEPTVVKDENTECKQAAKDGSVLATENENQVPQKPRGRGRPRKVKSEIGVKGSDTETKSVAKPSNQHQNKKDDTALSTPSATEAVQSLRRSSRIPTKNCRFKDDYVDGSILTSKSTSGDTRLMTLALAAECHTSKPNKPTATLTKQSLSAATQSDNSSGENDDKPFSGDMKTTEICGNEREDKCEKEKDIVLTGLRNLTAGVCATNKSQGQTKLLLNSVLKRPLRSQLNASIKKSKHQLSEESVQLDLANENEFAYYVIMEPKLKPLGDGLFIQKQREGIKYNVANLTGNIGPSQINHDSNTYPQARYYACSLCERVLMSPHHWATHCKDTHSLNSLESPYKSTTLEKETYSCKRCSQKFPFQFMLDNHLQRQNQCGCFNCSLCDQKLSSQQELDEHHTLAHPAKRCIACGKVFDDIVILRKHAIICHGKRTLSSESDTSKQREKMFENVVIKSENMLTDQEEEVLKQRESDNNKFYEMMEGEGVDAAGVKIECELCGLKFSTFSGVWHHKLDIHQELYPPGFRDKLEARLNKNKQVLASVSATVTDEKDKNNYFVIMKPKWYCSVPQLKVSMENKKINFSPVELKSENSLDTVVSAQLSSFSLKGVVFTCHECSISYQSAPSYREHRSKIHNECFETMRYLGAFQCSYCSDTFPCQFMLDEHVKQHTGKKVLPCTLCGLTFHKIQERRQHWKRVHPGVGCPNCGKMYASIRYLQKHISLNCQDHFPASKKFIAFRKKQHNDFYMEEKDKRVEKKIIKCHLCPKICSSIHGWRRHMSENHEDEGFSKLSNTCIVCNEVIYGYKALEKHLLEVHAEESGLPIEEENTIVTEALKRSKVDIGDYQKAGKSNTNIYQDEEGMFHCPECPKTHSDLKALIIHIKTHINMQLECSVCKKSFKNPTLLKQHVKRHRTTAVYDCNSCNKKFMTIQKLNKHNKVHHTKESFVCELCGMSFALNDYLLKHKRCHTDKRPHLCSVCGKTFRTKPELRVHVLIHTQETPYVCEHCGRGFTQKGNWRIHLAQHTGVKPHKCKHCDLSFALPSHLKRHQLTHNQKINYRCIWCDKECTLRKHMQMHVSRVHKEDFFHYEEQMKLDDPIPIAPSQLKIYNRRLGKAGQVRKAYKTRAKKCESSIQDILDGVPRFEANEEEMLQSEDVVIKPLIEQNEETVTSDDIGITNQDITVTENMQILVSEDHQNYVKHGLPTGLIEDDGSNVEIIMGENNEINIIINNSEAGIGTDLTLQDGLDGNGAVSLTQFTDSSGQLPSSLQQAVNALVAGQKGEDLEGEETELPLDMEAIMPEDGVDNYTIIYPSGS